MNLFHWRVSTISKVLNDSVYMGTTVSAGQAIMQVGIGSSTKMGAIALQIQEKETATPPQVKSRVSKQLIFIVSTLVFLVLVIGAIWID